MNLQCFLRHYFHHHHHHCHQLRPRCNLVHQAEERLSHQLILYIIGEDTVFGDSPCKWHTDNIRSRCISGRFEDSHCKFKHKPFYHFHQYHRHGLCHYMVTFIIIIYSIFHIDLFLMPVTAAGSQVLPLTAHISTFCIGNMSILWKNERQFSFLFLWQIIQ